MCVGKEYAINHLVAFLSILSTKVQWTRRMTSQSQKIAYLPTIYPADCFVTLKPYSRQ
jgi:cytochrome P450 family 710 subfamily A protein